MCAVPGVGMLAFDLAVALFTLTYGQPPSDAEHGALLAAVQDMYAHLRIAPTADPDEALTQLRTHARVRDVLDVALDGPSVSEPHSFITDFEELHRTVARNRALVVQGLGCAVHHRGACYLIDAKGQRLVGDAELRAAFEARRPCRSVVLLQA